MKERIENAALVVVGIGGAILMALLIIAAIEWVFGLYHPFLPPLPFGLPLGLPFPFGIAFGFRL